MIFSLVETPKAWSWIVSHSQILPHMSCVFSVTCCNGHTDDSLFLKGHYALDSYWENIPFHIFRHPYTCWTGLLQISLQNTPCQPVTGSRPSQTGSSRRQSHSQSSLPPKRQLLSFRLCLSLCNNASVGTRSCVLLAKMRSLVASECVWNPQKLIGQGTVWARRFLQKASAVLAVFCGRSDVAISVCGRPISILHSLPFRFWSIVIFNWKQRRNQCGWRCTGRFWKVGHALNTWFCHSVSPQNRKGRL